jgi:hypothetical protein
MLSTMKQYTLLCVVNSDISAYGTMHYQSGDSLRKNITLTVNDSLRFKPIPEDELDGTMQLLISMMKPMMKQMLGQMGEHLSFFVFKNTDLRGNYYADAAQRGKFSVSWGNESFFEWILPLDVLTPAKYCSVDKQKLSGKFDYCPYHGVKLNATKK